MVFLSAVPPPKEMNGVPAIELFRATLASLGMVFALIATVEDTIEKIRTSTAFGIVAAGSHSV